MKDKITGNVHFKHCKINKFYYVGDGFIRTDIIEFNEVGVKVLIKEALDRGVDEIRVYEALNFLFTIKLEEGAFRKTQNGDYIMHLS